MSEQTPRINAPLLDQFVGRTIRLVGKVTAVHGNKATLDSNGQVIAHLDRDSTLRIGSAAELVAKVNPDRSVRVLTSTDFGDNLDMGVYGELVNICQQYKEVFYDS
ncbi:replication factor A protein 3 [Choiromyces venosus 120613-1]|uniref:Replication factor A protein 3 n=1 Tax=Choiromyces venosus 120613-1 TaxID=1336337 RepID=A0A3N4JAI7_9PEZI|nr:replication factor A protein 3 [Choiromyces venosus 120613-1]